MPQDIEPLRRERVDEETPLLVDLERQNNDEEVDTKSGETSDRSWYAWRIFWFLVALLVLGVFVKGWIDAGSDVNVRDLIDILIIMTDN